LITYQNVFLNHKDKSVWSSWNYKTISYLLFCNVLYKGKSDQKNMQLFNELVLDCSSVIVKVETCFYVRTRIDTLDVCSNHSTVSFIIMDITSF